MKVKSFAIAEVEEQRLKKMSGKTGLSVSELIRRSIDSYYEDNFQTDRDADRISKERAEVLKRAFSKGDDEL